MRKLTWIIRPTVWFWGGFLYKWQWMQYMRFSQHHDEYWTFWDVMPCPPANSYRKVNYISADVVLTPQKNWIFMILSDHTSIKGGKFLEQWSIGLVLKGFVYGVNTVCRCTWFIFIHCQVCGFLRVYTGCDSGTWQNFLALISTFLHSVMACCSKVSVCTHSMKCQSVNQTHKQCYKMLFWYFTVCNSAGTGPTILNVLLFSGQD